MDKIEKALNRLTDKERKWVEAILRQLRSGEVSALQIKKLKGREDIFRVRKGNLRVIYRRSQAKEIFILTIERRREDTYKF